MREKSHGVRLSITSSHNKRELFYCPANKQRGGV
nr:MAG TPA: hypothetical protein [Caudoviricetes sp.]DAT02983.1 MAG TPA: hypothetical protein [Caudoviricetes sp.]